MEALGRLRQKLAGAMTGPVSIPGDVSFQETTAIWARPKILPRLVAHCADEADVVIAVRSAREMGITLSVRGGGHNWTGRALCDGLVLDLSRMNSAVRIGDGLTIEIGGGAKGTDVFAATDPAGMAPVLGSVGDIGVAGLVTGGGYGPLLRRFGLASDNLRAATVVLANGTAVRAAEDGDAELFWAIRGGGGNFGVVTSMELQLRPLASVCSGILLYPFDSEVVVLSRLQEIWANAPIELDVQVGIVPGRDGNSVIYLSPTWSGDPAEASAALAPLFAIPGRLMDDVRTQPFGASRAFFDEHIIKGLLTFADTLWLREWNEEVVKVVMDAMRRRPSPLCFVLCHEFSGIAAKVPEASTAFGFRTPHIWFEIIAPADPSSGSDGQAEARWAREVTQSLKPHAFPGGYANMLAPDQHHRIRWSFGSNASRIVAAKRQYDPENVFQSAISLPNIADTGP